MQRRGDTAPTLAAQARSAEQNHNWKQATGLLEQAVRDSPDDMELRKRLIRSHLGNGDREAARDELRQVAALKPDDPDRCVEFAEFARQCHDQAATGRFLQLALAQDSAHLPALLLLARLLETQKEPLAAVAVYHRVLDIDHDHAAAKLRLAAHHLQNGAPEQSAVLLRGVCNAPSVSSSEKCEARWQLGLAYGEAGRWKEAADSLQRSIAAMPSPTADQYYQMAFAYARSGETAAARDALNRSLSISPTHRSSRELLATLSADRGSIRFASLRNPASGP